MTSASIAERLLITGGAGFVGASAAVDLASRHPDWEITALDNHKRRGGELNLQRLRERGVAFVHGDVRDVNDLQVLPEVARSSSAQPNPRFSSAWTAAPTT